MHTYKFLYIRTYKETRMHIHKHTNTHTSNSAITEAVLLTGLRRAP